MATRLKNLANNYNKHYKNNKNQVFEQNWLKNHNLLKTGSTESDLKSQRKLAWVFQKIFKNLELVGGSLRFSKI